MDFSDFVDYSAEYADDFPSRKFRPQETIKVNSKLDLDKCVHEVNHAWDANAASLVKYFVYAEEFPNPMTGYRYPQTCDQEVVRLFKVIMDKCSNLRVLAIHKNQCTALAVTISTASAMKKVANELLGQHPNLTRLVQYGGMSHNGINDNCITWALISKHDEELGDWALTPKAQILASFEDLSESAAPPAVLPQANQQPENHNTKTPDDVDVSSSDYESSDGENSCTKALDDIVEAFSSDEEMICTFNVIDDDDSDDDDSDDDDSDDDDSDDDDSDDDSSDDNSSDDNSNSDDDNNDNNDNDDDTAPAAAPAANDTSSTSTSNKETATSPPSPNPTHPTTSTSRLRTSTLPNASTLPIRKSRPDTSIAMAEYYAEGTSEQRRLEINRESFARTRERQERNRRQRVAPGDGEEKEEGGGAA